MAMSISAFPSNHFVGLNSVRWPRTPRKPLAHNPTEYLRRFIEFDIKGWSLQEDGPELISLRLDMPGSQSQFPLSAWVSPIAAETLRVSKVPAITLGFWIIKILATTLGETGGDTVTMSWLGETTDNPVPYGYLIGSAIFGILLVLLIYAQIRASKFNPWFYWATIVASTTYGTTLADFADRSLGIGYPGGSLLLLSCVQLSLFAWHRTLGTINVNTIVTRKAEAFYWLTITLSQTLGTALGDWAADDFVPDAGWGLGYSGGALAFGAGLALLASLYYTTKVSRVTLFWAAFILTRPFGATVGDWFDRPVADGGLAMSRPMASAVLAIVIVVLVLVLPQRPGSHAGPVKARA